MRGTQLTALRRAAALTVAAALLVGLAGCSLGEKSRYAKLLLAAPNALRASPGLHLDLAVTSTVLDRVGLTGKVPTDPGLDLTGTVDLSHGTAAYSVAGHPGPRVVFDGFHYYARRPDAAADDARPWMAVTATKDLHERLDPLDTPSSLAAYVLTPVVLIDAMGGGLAGSIVRKPTEDVGGVATTPYEANFDIDKALSKATRTRYSQTEKDTVSRLLDVVGVKASTLHRGTVWLDAAGVPRRFRLVLREEPSTRVVIAVTLDATFIPGTAPAPVEVPDRNALVSVGSFFQFLRPQVAAP